MSEIQLIIIILASAASLWQIGLIVMGSAMLRSGQYNSVSIGFVPGIVAIILFIAVVLL